MELIIFLQFSHSINLREAENANSKGKQEKRQNLKRVLVIITIKFSTKSLLFSSSLSVHDNANKTCTIYAYIILN